MSGRIIYIRPENTTTDDLRYFIGDINKIITYEKTYTPYYYHLEYNPTIWKIIVNY